MLSAIATSMITVAGVTFSITIVAITQASNQFTPRILRNFMRDRANQFVLGVFAGVFAYCLVVLRTVRGGEEAFIPSLSINVGLLIALAGVAVPTSYPRPRHATERSHTGVHAGQGPRSPSQQVRA